MLKQVDLITLKKGDNLDHYLVIRKCEIRLTKANKEFLNLELGDKSATYNSNMFENFNKVYSNFKTGDIVKVTGKIDDYQGTPQIRITKIEVPDPALKILHRDFLPKSKRNLKEMQDEFFKRIELIADRNLKTLLQNIFNEENFEKFSTAPAGKSWHHSYIHGLLEHTLEIIKICDLMCDIHPELNRDILISGAMLHDFGKVEELNFDTDFNYTDKGKLIGHIVIAAMLVEQEAKKIPGFPDDLKDCLIHLVLSHQGKLEYATPVVPKTVEAIALYQADELSAKVNAYKNAVSSEVKSDSKWTKYISLVSTDLFDHGIAPAQKKEINKSLFD